MLFLVLLILAIVFIVAFSKMTLYVIGGIIGILLVLLSYFIRRRRK